MHIEILICMPMRTTLNLNEELFRKAVKNTGVHEKTKLIHLGLESLIRQAAQNRLARLHGLIPKAKAAPRKKRHDPR